MSRIHENLFVYNAATMNRANEIRIQIKDIELFLKNKDLTYCPKTIELREFEKLNFIINKEQQLKRYINAVNSY